ncbi:MULTISPECIES: hypothetical protein [Streptomyces]|uniref:hypothetical protein n=1 Tax=Streptomyces TaxID=1883 RepID=UPI0029B2CE3E|nr:hypothetical protein [Streptomyces sp. WI03-4A]MDX2594926.1 hypothetical protein [Streptomyces sp. WI03-4A]
MRVTTRSKTQSRRPRWGARFTGVGMAAAVALGIAAGPAAAAEVPPIFVPGNPAAVCPDGSDALRVNPSTTPQTFHIVLPDGGTGDVTVTFSNGIKDVDFSIAQPNTLAVRQVTVKGGDNANRYLYDAVTGFPNGIDSDSGLISPLNNGGQLPDVSHADFCFIRDNYS